MKSIIFYNKRIIQQLFLECNVAWFIWRIVHRIWLTTTNWYDFFFKHGYNKWIQRYDMNFCSNMVTTNGSKATISNLSGSMCFLCSLYGFDQKNINYSLIYMLFLGQPMGCSSSQCFKRSSTNKIWSGYAEWWRLQQYRILGKIGRGLLIG